MKKSDWIISAATLAYSYLFYQQLAGINFPVFAILLSILLAVLHKDVWKDKKWLLYAGLSVSSAFFVMWHNSTLAIWANICSLLLLSAVSINRNSSVLFNGAYSLYSIAGSYVFIIINSVKRHESRPEGAPSSGRKGINILIGLAVFIIALVFFFIYKNANPLFEKFTEKINLDFISGPWIVFTLIGFFVVYGFFKHQRIQSIDEWESKLPVTLSNNGSKIRSFEKTAGIALFVLLNSMLLFINVLDVVYLYVLDQLPEGISHTQFVHNGVGMIILSIVLGIAIILFLFRNAMNFEDKNKVIKMLVAVWILQNAMMVISTCLRNYIYVDLFNLTYKRIGVFVYLTLSMIGLFLTLYKILFKKSNWFLVRTNAFCCFLFLCFSSFINWDRVICEFNIERKAAQLQKLDKKYLISLSDESLPYLQAIKNKKGFETDSVKTDGYRGGSEMDFVSGMDYRLSYGSNSSATDAKTYRFLKKINEYPGWQSWNYRNEHVLNALKTLNENSKIESLALTNQELDSAGILRVFSNVREADLNNCTGNHFGFLDAFTKITKLTISGNNIKHLKELPKLLSLQTLILNYTALYSIDGIAGFPNVEHLSISNTPVKQLQQIPVNSRIRSIEANNCASLKDLRGLNNATSIEKLSLDGAAALEFFPALPSLITLSLSNGNNVNTNLSLIPMLDKLGELNISGNAYLEPDRLMFFDQRTSSNYKRFPKLKRLYASSDNLDSASILSEYNELEVLQLDNNKLKNTLFIASYNGLKELSLSANHLEQLKFSEKHSSLQKLNISNNQYLGDFSDLKFLTKLISLDVSSTRFDNLSLLACENTLMELNISSCRISSPEALLQFKKLEVLHMAVLSEKDMAVLKKMKALKELHLTAQGITDKEIKELRKQLPNIQSITYEPS